MTNPRKILVTGATGNIGRHVVAGLLARGAAVRAVSRTPTAAVLPAGVEVGAGDLTRPETLRPALSDVDAVFLLWPFLSADGVPEVVDVIAAGARHVVYVSTMNVRDDADAEANGVWGQVEDAVRRAGLEWTFLRPAGFATNTLEWAPTIQAGEPVRMAHPRAARSLIHEADIAEVAVLALAEEGHTGKAYVLTGPESITQADQARVLCEVAGRPARIRELTPEEARLEVEAWSGPALADGVLAYLASLVDAPEPVTNTVAELTGKPARSFERWARDHVGDFRVPPPARQGE